METLSNNISRPLLRYHGGKFMLAKWIIGHFPEHKVFVDAFGGGGSILLQKPRSYSEVYNDLDGEIVNVFKVIREKGEQLQQLIELTPYSRFEFEQSYLPATDDLEQARRTIVRAFMGFSSASTSGQKTGFRARNGYDSGSATGTHWRNYPEGFTGYIDRLRGVVIENKDAFEVSKQHDGSKTLHYWDPPYVLDTRYGKQKTQCYRYEMTNDQHVELCKKAKELKGMIIISGYDNPIYNEFLADWYRLERKALINGKDEKTEILWLSLNCI